MGRLTTHVLDTMTGGPATGMAVELLEARSEGGWVHLGHFSTNADGRIDAPLLAGDALHKGQFQLRFHVADYFRRSGVNLPEPPFLDIVPIHFGIADAAGHYHVPLLVSPYAYSTYRGS